MFSLLYKIWKFVIDSLKYFESLLELESANSFLLESSDASKFLTFILICYVYFALLTDLFDEGWLI